MKINQNLRPTIESSRNELRQATPVQKEFGLFIQKHGQRMEAEQFNRLISEVEEQGGRIARSRSFRDLAKFKSLVKKFLKEAVEQGFDLNQENSWTIEGYSRNLSTIQIVDESLVKLAEMVLDDQRSSLEILEKIGEIKGLLINIYT